MRLYEAVIILDPNADTDARVDAVSKKLEAHGATEISVDRWGKKRFAYEIDRKQYGDYTSIRFNVEPKQIEEIEHEFRITEELIRFLVYRVTKAQLKKQVNLLKKQLSELDPKSDDYRKLYNLWVIKTNLLNDD